MEPIQGSETSAFNNNQTPGKYPEELLSCVTDVQQYVPSLPLVDEWYSFVPLNVHPFHPRRKISAVGI